MALPTTQELKCAIVDILTRARGEGRLGELTVRIVLRHLATHYGVEQDVFQSETYKPFIKATVFETVNSFDSAEASEGDAGPPQRKPRKEPKSDREAKSGKRKRLLPTRAQVTSDKEVPEEVDVSECEAPQSKAASLHSKSSKPGKTSRKPESETKFKSKAIIESSDEEAAPESNTRKSACSPPKEKTTTRPSPVKRKKANKVDSDVEMDTNSGPIPSGSRPKLKLAPDSPKYSVSKAKESTRDLMESELSSVIDEPQTKRQKKQEKPTKSVKDEKPKRAKEAMSKDEEMVNKLKGIVVACGVRKVWKKEFEGLDKPSQQIKRLHSILGELGMTPRYSLEKAKAIREERELAQELKDVQEFDRSTKRRGKGMRSQSETGESSDSDGMPSRKKKNARASIMAFLQDQSEEE